MAYSRDFVSVIIKDDGTTVEVSATSTDTETLKPGSDDPATAVRVLIVCPPDFDRPLVSDPVVGTPGIGAQWDASFPHAAPPLVDGQDVLVIGIASSPETGSPFVWGSMEKIALKSNV